jgi:hypothetical protein
MFAYEVLIKILAKTYRAEKSFIKSAPGGPDKELAMQVRENSFASKRSLSGQL